ncbi:hypothetical protein EMCRGX_G005495 [Ephydatia muelleri]
MNTVKSSAHLTPGTTTIRPFATSTLNSSWIQEMKEDPLPPLHLPVHQPRSPLNLNHGVIMESGKEEPSPLPRTQLFEVT